MRIITRKNRPAVAVLTAIAVFIALMIAPPQTSANAERSAGNTRSITPFADRKIRVVSTSAVAGGQVLVSIELDSMGNEVAASFTVNFNPGILSSPVVTLGSGAPAGTTLNLNTNEVGSGLLGVLVYSGNPFVLSGPARQIVTVRFNVAAGSPAGATFISFVNSPTPLSVSSILGVLLPTIYDVGAVAVTIPAPTLVTIGGKVTTPAGQNLRNAVVTLTDANNVRRTATTGTFGQYSFADVQTGGTYTLTVSSKRYRFSPQVVTITESLTNLNFVGLE